MSEMMIFPDYVASGTVDLGILGQNILNEERPKVKKLLNLRFGSCSLVLAVPKDSTVQNAENLKNKTIATTYPQSTKYFFKQSKIPVKVVRISGSVEITPALGVAQGIVDLVSSGSTLALNDLRMLNKLYDSEAVFIANDRAVKDQNKAFILNRLLTRFRGVLSARNYKYIMMNIPKEILPKIKKIIPGLRSPTISPLAKDGWISVQSVVKEDIFWETVDRLKKVGVSAIYILPIEKMIT